MRARNLFVVLMLAFVVGCKTTGSSTSSRTAGLSLWVLTENSQLHVKPNMTGSSFVLETRDCMNLVTSPSENLDISDVMFTALAEVARTREFPKCMRNKGFWIANIPGETATKLSDGKPDDYYLKTITELKSAGAFEGVDRWPELLAHGGLDDLRQYLERYESRIYIQAAEIRYATMKK